MTTPFVSDRHRRQLEVESGIAPDVITERGYTTVTSRAELGRRGFSEPQRLVPALLLPTWTVHGEQGLAQIRPDEPRVRDSKKIKYDMPKNARMTLDVHPRVRTHLGNPTTPLWITEGIKKGDSLVSHGGLVVTLLGVWTWRGTNEWGGKMALPDWDAVALNERLVYVVFDSDVMVKPQVHWALSRLKEFLEQRGAQVQIIYLPCGYGGAKCGVDDFLVTGKTIDDLVKYATTDLVSSPTDRDQGPSHPYRKTPQGIIVMKRGRDGEDTMILSNFTAEIVAERRIDNGAELSREYTIEAIVGGVTNRCRVPVTEFSNLQWVPRELGARAILPAGRTSQDALRQAIQCLSEDIETIDEYAHTGWRKINGQWVYLHGGGAIGLEGPIAGIDVKLSPKLSTYKLTIAPSPEILRRAIRASVDLLTLARGSQMLPLMAAVFLAPLSEVLGAHRTDFVLVLQGPTGAQKTELAALAQSHYGPCDRLHLPASFRDTPATIEKVLFEGKDALVVVDDLHPSQNPAEAHRMNEIYAALMRGVGNGRMRGRMRSDMTARPDYPPRAMTIATVERSIDGHSNASRQLPVCLPLGAVDLDRLTVAQAARPLYQHVMAAYVHDLAGRFQSLQETLPAQFLSYQIAAQGLRGHARNPGQVAHLMLGFDGFITLAVTHQVMSQDDADAWRDKAWRYFLELAREHGNVLKSESVVARFLDLLANAFASKAAYLESKSGGAPSDAEAWGWQVTYYRNPKTGEEDRQVRCTASAKLLGKIDHLCIYLYPETTYQYLTTAARSAEQVFPVDLNTLTKRLDEAKLIEVEEEGNTRRRQVRVSIEGQKLRVIKLKRAALDAADGKREPPGHEAGTPKSPEQKGNEALMPKVPTVPTYNDRIASGKSRHDEVGSLVESVTEDLYQKGGNFGNRREPPDVVDLRSED